MVRYGAYAIAFNQDVSFISNLSLYFEHRPLTITPSLAKQIYGSGARFVFELLQNADDNSFTKAVRAGDSPSISFQVHPDRIIIECNEDGFNKNDLNAICNVGQSTKSTQYGYIGAKGIGFKSVFIAAWKVYIQSGYFSFSFRHKQGDSGLGMVRPIWEETDEELTGPLTRMTLYIHNTGDPAEIEHLKRTVHKQFEDLKATCLLFLRKLKRISVSFYSQNGTLQRSKTFEAASTGGYTVCLKKTSITDGERGEDTQIYHVTKHTARRLTKSDNRDLPDTSDAREISSTAEVVLAFPMTKDSEPITETQEIFAFLPIRESQYKV